MTQKSISLTIVAWCLIMLLLLIETSEAILMKIPKTGHKCVSEEIQNNVIVMADYVIYPGEHTHLIPPVSVVVTSPNGNNIHHQENVTHGQFAFTSGEEGLYLACFWIDNVHGDTGGTGDMTVNLDWKTGIAAKDWDSFAKKEKIEFTMVHCKAALAGCGGKSMQGVELELKKLEEAVEAIHRSLIYLKRREVDMRTFSEKTNSRVAWFSIMSLGICIGVSALQLWHLKTYFQRKKLI